MKIIYDITIRFTAVFEAEGPEPDEKSALEYGRNIGELVCDEMTLAEAVGDYEILKAKKIKR